MLILLYGPNTYARDEKSHELIKAAREKYTDALYACFNLVDENVLSQAHDFLFDSGLFAQGKKIIQLSHVDEVSDNTVLSRMLNRAQNNDVLCVITEKWIKKELTAAQKKIFSNSIYKSQFFSPYTQTQATKVLLDIAREKGVSLDASAAGRIYEYAGNDMYGACHELERLTLLTDHITTSVLSTLQEYAEKREIFDFARAITSFSPLSRRLELWEYMKFQRVEPFLIFGYLAKMAKKEPLIRALAQVDELVKSGRLEMDQALEEIIFSG